jgi:hypothetical protein
MPIVQNSSPPVVPMSSHAASSTDRRWRIAGLGFCLLMWGLHIAGALNSAGLPDFWRDFYWATAIAHGEAFPLAGPPIYQLFELGPWWFYLLALPVAVTGSVAMTMVFIQTLAALKYFLAWRIGLRIADARLGLAFAASLAVAGWSMVGLLFPSHVAVVETTLLLLVLVGWRCAKEFSALNAVWLGLAGAACLHAHPTTALAVILVGGYVLWRHRSWTALGWMCLAAAIAAASLLPPWFDRNADVANELKPMATYLGSDIGQHPIERIAAVAHGALLGGAWWGLLLMTPWKTALVKIAWWILCACLLLAASGLLLIHRQERRLHRLFLGALAVFVLQVAFVVLLRPVTPNWMLPSCLPPLALMIALGWYGWLRDGRARVRACGVLALSAYVALSLAPYSYWLRDLHDVRAMVGANPLFNATESSDRYEKVVVPFFPLRRIDRLSGALCGPHVLHALLASTIEMTFAATLRNACGSWPDLRYGGTEGAGTHVAGLSPPAATASGIAPARVISRMALYERVRAIAPISGGRSTRLRRRQISAETGPGPIARSVFDFDTEGADAVVLTNRMRLAGPMIVAAVTAADRPASQLFDGGGLFVYGCAACAANANTHWHIELDGIEENLDLIVLLHDDDQLRGDGSQDRQLSDGAGTSAAH